MLAPPPFSISIMHPPDCQPQPGTHVAHWAANLAPTPQTARYIGAVGGARNRYLPSWTGRGRMAACSVRQPRYLIRPAFLCPTIRPQPPWPMGHMRVSHGSIACLSVAQASKRAQPASSRPSSGPGPGTGGRDMTSEEDKEEDEDEGESARPRTENAEKKRSRILSPSVAQRSPAPNSSSQQQPTSKTPSRPPASLSLSLSLSPFLCCL